MYARTANQHLLTVDGPGDGLLVLARQLPTRHRPKGGVLALLTAYLDAAAFADVERRWGIWWESVRLVADESPGPPD